MNKVCIIGFPEAALTQDIQNIMHEFYHVSVKTPDEALFSKIQLDEQYIVSVTQDLALRQQLCEWLDKNQLSRATFVHPTASVSSQANLASGVFVGPFASVFCHASIAKDCIVGPYSMVSHFSNIGKNTLIHPGSMIAGSTNIGENCLLGLRSTVLDHLTICNGVTVGAGSMITKSITQSGKYVGNPARKVQ